MTTHRTPTAHPAPASPPADRYGRPRTLGRRTRVALLAALGAAAVGVAAWFGLASAARPVTWQEVGFTLGEDDVAVVFDVTRPDPSRPVRCTVEALDEAHGQVGYHHVDVPAADSRTVRRTVVVRTVAPAVTGLVDRCEPLDGT